VIAVLDNYDSFTWSLVQCLGTLGATVEVFRNDVLTPGELGELPLEGLVISSGPGEPRHAGISEAAILRLAGRVPVLGVGLGHLAVGESHGGRVVRAARTMHGRTSPVLHRGRGLFAGLDNPFAGMRYHALLLERESLPACLELVAWTPDGEIMGLRHRDHETWGVQFHPESILTRHGLRLIENFLALCRQQRSTR
jgi:anthranilate synthase component 2